MTVIHTCVNTQTVHRGCNGHNQVSSEKMMMELL